MYDAELEEAARVWLAALGLWKERRLGCVTVERATEAGGEDLPAFARPLNFKRSRKACADASADATVDSEL
jgi:hypothetical protein